MDGRLTGRRKEGKAKERKREYKNRLLFLKERASAGMVDSCSSTE
jgi:hypothetical protein